MPRKRICRSATMARSGAGTPRSARSRPGRRLSPRPSRPPLPRSRVCRRKKAAGMSEPLGRLLAVGNVAEVFEYGPRVVKLYKAEAAKPVAFREASTHAAVEALGLP